MYKISVAVSVEQFEATAEAVVALRAEGAVRLLVQSPQPLAGAAAPMFRFVVRKNDERVAAYFSVQERDYQQFRDSLPDLAEALTLITRPMNIDEFVDFREGEQSGRIHDAPEAARKKYEVVTHLFSIDELRRRLWIKRTTKNDLAKTIDWDVSTKLTDDDLQHPGGDPVPFGTLRLETGGTVPSFVEFMTGKGSNALVLTLDLEDLDYLIDSLARMRLSLAEVQ